MGYPGCQILFHYKVDSFILRVPKIQKSTHSILEWDAAQYLQVSARTIREFETRLWIPKYTTRCQHLALSF